jgi:hypothetical protein
MASADDLEEIADEFPEIDWDWDDFYDELEGLDDAEDTSYDATT